MEAGRSGLELKIRAASPQRHFTPDVLLSYHGDPAVKATYIKRFADHRAASEVVQSVGFDSLYGRFIGYMLHTDQPEWLPIDVGWPIWFGELIEAIFGGLPMNEAIQFGADVLEAMPVGADLEVVRIPFLLSVQQRNIVRLAGNSAACAQQCRQAVQVVIEYLQHQNDQQPIAEPAAWAAVESAWMAASAKTTARKSAREEVMAALSTESAARAAALSTRAVPLAAWASARAEKWNTKPRTRSAEWRLQSETLLSLLRGISSA